MFITPIAILRSFTFKSGQQSAYSTCDCSHRVVANMDSDHVASAVQSNKKDNFNQRWDRLKSCFSNDFEENRLLSIMDLHKACLQAFPALDHGSEVPSSLVHIVMSRLTLWGDDVASTKCDQAEKSRSFLFGPFQLASNYTSLKYRLLGILLELGNLILRGRRD